MAARRAVTAEMLTAKGELRKVYDDEESDTDK
eukprot:CAMPEP_0194322762 /NCGR_PEP_ID=MMETSP0171-20130528/22265_1 /TAXON_ID=218684 /ORGANISM="Corethron pennatum, Strain L29A3" /LENGTH=31 /DNA_ID= /DNA_START= /DNA_END= /DNA_ORIENTATION=